MSAWSSLVSVSWRATPTNIDREHRPRTRSYSTGLGGGTNGRGRGQDYPASTRSVLRHYPVSTPAKKYKKRFDERGEGERNPKQVAGVRVDSGNRVSPRSRMSFIRRNQHPGENPVANRAERDGTPMAAREWSARTFHKLRSRRRKEAEGCAPVARGPRPYVAPGGPPPYVGGYMRLAFQAGCEISGLAFDPAQRSKTIPT